MTGEINERTAHTVWYQYYIDNDLDGVSNHRRLNCLLNRLFRRRSKKTSKLHATGILWGESTGDRWIPIGTVTRKIFPFDVVIMDWDLSLVSIMCRKWSWGPLLLTRINLSPNMDKQLHPFPNFNDSDSDSDKVYSTKTDTDIISGLHNFHEYTNNHKSLTYKWL